MAGIDSNTDKLDIWARWLLEVRAHLLQEQAPGVSRVPQGASIWWATFVRRSGNPRIPSYAEVMAETLTPAEIEAYTRHMRPLVEQGQGVRRMATAFMRALKP